MAVSIIEQSPSVLTLPVGQDIIFVISNDTAVANESKVKFGVEIHIWFKKCYRKLCKTW